MFCSVCGKQLSDGERFCTACGAEQHPGSAASGDPQQNAAPNQEPYPQYARTGFAPQSGAPGASLAGSTGTYGTSIVPLILGVVGAVLMLPGLVCAAFCGSVADRSSELQSILETGTASSTNVSEFVAIIIGLIPIALGIFGGIKGKSAPLLSFILLLAAAVVACIGWILTSFTSFFHLGALICFVIGGIIAKVQKLV